MRAASTGWKGAMSGSSEPRPAALLTSAQTSSSARFVRYYNVNLFDSPFFKVIILIMRCPPVLRAISITEAVPCPLRPSAVAADFARVTTRR